MFAHHRVLCGVFIASTLIIAACSGSSSPAESGDSVERSDGTTSISPVVVDDTLPITSEATPSATESSTTSTSTTTTTTLPPPPPMFDIEETIYDPVDYQPFTGRQRGLLPTGPDRVPGFTYTAPAEPAGPCAFSWSGDLIGIAGGDYLFIEACEFPDDTEAAEHAAAVAAHHSDLEAQRGDREDATIEPIEAVGPFVGAAVTYPATADRSQFVRAQLSASYGLRTYELIVSSRIEEGSTPDDNARRSRELAQLQVDFWTTIELAPDSLGTGFDRAADRYTTDDALLPYAQIADLAGETVTSVDTEYTPSIGIGFGNIARDATGSRAVAFGDHTVTFSVESYDTPGDATRRLGTLDSVLDFTSPVTPVDGIADAVREDDRSVSDTIRFTRDDRLYSVEVSMPGPAGNADGELVVRLAAALVTHQDLLGLDSAPADDVALRPLAVDFDLENLLPIELALADGRMLSRTRLASYSQFHFDGQRQFFGRYDLDGNEFNLAIDARHDDRTTISYDGDVEPNAETWSIRLPDDGGPAFVKYVGDYSVGIYMNDDVLAASGGDLSATNPIVAAVDEHMIDAGLGDTPLIDREDFVALARPLELVNPDNLGGESFSVTGSNFRMEERFDVPDRLRSAGGLPADAPEGALGVWHNDIDIAEDGAAGASMRAIRFDTAEQAATYVGDLLGTDGIEPVQLVEIGGIHPTGEGGVFAMAHGSWAFVIDNQRLSAIENRGGDSSSPLDALRTDAVGHALLVRESGLR